MNCEAAQSGNLAERYVLGQLDEPELTTFEEHYYVCDRCLDEVRLLQALQSGGTVTRAPARRRASWNVTWAAIAAAIVAVAGLAAFMLMRSGPSQVAPTAKVVPVPNVHDESPLLLLARVEPPRYIPSKLRGASEKSTEAFRAAMDQYTRGDYGSAAEALRPLAKPSPDTVAPLFYLGICELMTGDADNAAAHLRGAAVQGDTPYLEPARFFLAKALIAKRDVPGASAALEQTIQLKGDRETEARQLLDKLRALPAPR